MEQLPLDLASPPRFGREDYLLFEANAAAFASIDRWPDWPDRVLLLLGSPGSGKSHLAAVWAKAAGAAPVVPGQIAHLVEAGRLDRPLLIEDADRGSLPEAALFHLLNMVRDQASFLLLTARLAPDLWGVRTPDLLSRLRLAPSVTIETPGEDAMAAVLVKLFADRQILVDETVVNYLVLHLDRSIADARAVVEELDRAALALNRRVTRAMAAKLLQGRLQPDELSGEQPRLDPDAT